jgi:hypothetical protein
MNFNLSLQVCSCVCDREKEREREIVCVEFTCFIMRRRGRKTDREKETMKKRDNSRAREAEKKARHTDRQTN